ncbi:MAG: acetate--CoA ligase family protein, partial [Alphaproteobacteria bacterium]|nr:acetate--CoA ligase family protein [Alphaproteobacteria bacterium]
MNIHAYQAKQLLKKFGVAVLNGSVAYTADEAEAAAKALGGPVWVVKSQIHAGGRGKGKFKEAEAGTAGGVRVVKSAQDVRTNALQMLGKTLVTHQTGPVGKEVKRVYIEQGCDIARELYLGMLIDRASGRITIMGSTEGGMEIEKVAAATPEKILKVGIDPVSGIQQF